RSLRRAGSGAPPGAGGDARRLVRGVDRQWRLGRGARRLAARTHAASPPRAQSHDGGGGGRARLGPERRHHFHPRRGGPPGNGDRVLRGGGRYAVVPVPDADWGPQMSVPRTYGVVAPAALDYLQRVAANPFALASDATMTSAAPARRRVVRVG